MDIKLKRREDLSQGHLKYLLDYDPISGLFTWKNPTHLKVNKGDLAGSIESKHGYVMITIYGLTFSAHRLVWLYVHGKFPRKYIDHKDGNPTNNSLENLREAGDVGNTQNREKPRNNTSGYKGVFKDGNVFRGQITANGIKQYFGWGKKPKDIAEMYDEKAQELHGEFARLNFPKTLTAKIPKKVLEKYKKPSKVKIEKQSLTQEKLQEVLHYDPDTGIFTWKVKPNGRVKVGSTAGVTRPDGYVKIKILGNSYQASHLAWLYVYGRFPQGEKFINHKNNNPSDNRIENLQLANRFQNAQNHKSPSTNTSGHKGVHKQGNKWRARITYKGKRIFLGDFTNPEKAYEAYKKAALKYHKGFANLEE